MSQATELRESDLQLILRIIDEGHADEPGDAMPWAVLEGLQHLVPCDAEVSFSETDYRRRCFLMDQGISPGGARYCEAMEDAPDDIFWPLFWGCTYCSYPQRTGDLATVIHDLDFSSPRERHRDPMYVEYVRPWGGAHSMMMSLPTAPGRTRRIVFWRGPGHPFSERDRQVVGLLRPHLYEIWLAAERRRNGVPQLTPREWEVLRLVPAGCSNAEIARQLVISVGTVRKHMEHILDRLAVSSRSAAVALALPHDPQLRSGAPE